MVIHAELMQKKMSSSADSCGLDLVKNRYTHPGNDFFIKLISKSPLNTTSRPRNVRTLMLTTAFYFFNRGCAEEAVRESNDDNDLTIGTTEVDININDPKGLNVTRKSPPLSGSDKQNKGDDKNEVVCK